MAINLTITDDKLQDAFNSHLDKLLETDNYNNPVKKCMEELLGYSGSMRGELGTKIKEFLAIQMDTPEFQAQLGTAIANEMAKRAVDALNKSK